MKQFQAVRITVIREEDGKDRLKVHCTRCGFNKVIREVPRGRLDEAEHEGAKIMHNHKFNCPAV